MLSSCCCHQLHCPSSEPWPSANVCLPPQGVEPAAAQQLTSLLGPQLRCLCDVKSAGGQEYYRLNDARVRRAEEGGNRGCKAASASMERGRDLSSTCRSQRPLPGFLQRELQ